MDGRLNRVEGLEIDNGFCWGKTNGTKKTLNTIPKTIFRDRRGQAMGALLVFLFQSGAGKKCFWQWSKRVFAGVRVRNIAGLECAMGYNKECARASRFALGLILMVPLRRTNLLIFCHLLRARRAGPVYFIS
jgi:hypothetical protein